MPEGGVSTFGELTLDEKCAISHRAVALRKFAKWYLADALRPAMVLNPGKSSRSVSIGEDTFASAWQEPPDTAHQQEGAELAHLQRR